MYIFIPAEGIPLRLLRIDGERMVVRKVGGRIAIPSCQKQIINGVVRCLKHDSVVNEE
jgi:hypothetical protein